MIVGCVSCQKFWSLESNLVGMAPPHNLTPSTLVRLPKTLVSWGTWLSQPLLTIADSTYDRVCQITWRERMNIMISSAQDYRHLWKSTACDPPTPSILRPTTLLLPATNPPITLYPTPYYPSDADSADVRTVKPISSAQESLWEDTGLSNACRFKVNCLSTYFDFMNELFFKFCGDHFERFKLWAVCKMTRDSGPLGRGLAKRGEGGGV